MNIKSNTRNINNYPNHMTVSRKPSSSTTTSFIHLRPHVNAKFNLCNATQRKQAPYYRKFQTGSTTTFSGYTNISNENKNRNSCLKQNVQNNNYIHSNSKFNKNTTENIPIPSLMSIHCFQQPPRKNRRSIQHAEQYKDRAPSIQPNYPNKNYNFTPTSNELQGIILSDSMCKYVRSEQVSTNNIKVTLSFESGCDCNRMLTFLEQMKTEKNKKIFEMDFLVFSLGTNDVANLGPEVAIQQCHDLIQYVRRLFPKLKSIGWLLLSLRWKPSKLFDSSQINENNKKFNELLKILSKQLNFEVIHTNLQHHHMHTDGLHPSIKSGRILIEKAIKNWFTKHTKSLPLDNNNNQHKISQQNQQQQQIRYQEQQKKQKSQHHQLDYQQQQQQQKQQLQIYEDNNRQHYQQQKQRQKQQKIQIQYHHKQYETKQYQEYQRNNVTTDNNNQYRWSVNQKYGRQQLPMKKLIPNYPHFLRHKQEFFRKIAIPAEFEKEKENIFMLSNLHFQTEILKLEAEKWRIYVESASEKKQVAQDRKQIETIIIDDNSIPIARPSPNNLANPPAPLDLSDLSELFDEWLPEPVPGKKRKLAQRQDNPPTPPSPRQPPPPITPPPIIPRKTLPPRNKDAPLQGGSVQSSPFYDKGEKNKNKQQHQQSYNVLLPLEKQIENNNENRNEIKQTTIINIDKDSSIVISPMESSTPEPRIYSPSVIPKDSI
ncbi:unnamed protein product, partial [Rotaria sp. Silwood1]